MLYIIEVAKSKLPRYAVFIRFTCILLDSTLYMSEEMKRPLVFL